MIKLGITEERILNKIASVIGNTLSRAGLFHHVFTRLKTAKSIERKFAEKRDEYGIGNKKMQDVFGVRVTLYFSDDSEIAINLTKQVFEELPDAHSIDKITNDKFGPQRNNLIFRIGSELSQTSRVFQNELIDTTFEVQFRTVLSEGWHEVEHDLRYKCKDDWVNEDALGRLLNGQLAALETSGWAMIKIFEDLAYKKYKEHKWSSFFRHTLRIRFEDSSFSDGINSAFDKKTQLAKDMLKIEREYLITPLTRITTQVPLKMDNVLFIMNRAILKTKVLEELEPPLLKTILNDSFK